MWYVNKLFDQPQIESLSSKGFLVRSSGGVVRIEKYGCGAELRKASEGRYQMTVIPSHHVAGAVHPPLGRGLSEIPADARRHEIPDSRGPARRSAAYSTKSCARLSAFPRITTKPSDPLASTRVYDRVKGRVETIRTKPSARTKKPSTRSTTHKKRKADPSRPHQYRGDSGCEH